MQLLLIFGFHSAPVYASTTLQPGDLAVIGYNADDANPNNRWAIVALATILVGAQVHITDAGIKENGAFYVNSNNEAHLTWTVTTLVPAGTVLAMTDASGNGGLNSYGTVSGRIGGASNTFTTAGDQIIIYQGTAGEAAGASFIYAFSTQQNPVNITALGAWQSTGTVAGATQSFLLPGLVNGLTANALTTGANTQNPTGSTGTGVLGTPNYGFDNMVYQGMTAGTKQSLLTSIATPSNWIGHDSTPYNIGVGSGCLFRQLYYNIEWLYGDV